MNIKQEKSDCCGATIVRFGGKRRQCVVCKKTWRIRPAKRGRKTLRRQCDYLTKVFRHGFSVKQLAVYSRLPVETIYKRFRNNLESILKEKRIVRIRGSKLILIIDAQWHCFGGQLWTLYFLSIKTVGSQSVIILDPILRLGKENTATWGRLINDLPRTVKKRLVAVVSDGIRGIETVVENNSWIIQRCHFHLLLQLQKMRGKRASTIGRLVREEIYQSVKLALIETSPNKLDELREYLITLITDDGCPQRMKMIVRDFLRRIEEFRNYLKYPELHLPTTTNVMESVNSLVVGKTKKMKTPYSWHKWAIACVRFKSKFICK